jgi:LysR family nitrogen assimilation transcriptional regulator
MTELNLTRLRYFSTIVRVGNLRRASEVLHIAQPALTRHVQLLERELDVVLLTRTPHGVVATEAGELLARGSDPLIQMSAQLSADVRSRAEVPRGVVRIGALPVITTLYLPAAIAACHSAWPQIRFRISQGNPRTLYGMVVEGSIDMAVCPLYSEHTDLEFEPLYYEDMWLVAKPGMIKTKGRRKSMEPADLAGVPLIISHYLHDQLERLIGADAMNVMVELDAMMPTDMIVTGVGAYVGPPSVHWQAIQSGQLEGRRIVGMRTCRGLIKKKARPRTAAMQIVAAQLRQSIADFAGSAGSPISLVK